MFFKNAIFYKLPDDFELNEAEFTDALSKKAFKPLSANTANTIGWFGALGKDTELFYATQGYVLLTLAIQDKILPASVIKEHTDERISDIEAKEGRKLRKKVRDEIKEDVIATLLPRAFSKTSYTRAYIDTHHKLLVIDTASSAVADRFTEFLRKTLGSLALERFKTDDPATMMTHWLQSHDYPQDLTIHDQCTLQAEAGGNTATIKCNGHDLLTDNIKAFINEGGMVTELSIGWKDQVDCLLTEELLFKGIKFLDVIKSANEDLKADSKEEQLAADFIIMAEALSEMIHDVVLIMGGFDDPVKSPNTPANDSKAKGGIHEQA
jgi:recombination associated protein RdgC